MKKKNKIEQELDRKEFENEIGRDLSTQYRKIDVDEKLIEGKNPYVLGFLHFISTFIFFELLYWLVKTNINFFTLGITLTVFEKLTPFIHLAVLILSINAVIMKKSVVDVIIDRWPF